MYIVFKPALLLLVFLLNALLLRAQNNAETDSLKIVLKKTTNTAEQAKLLSDLCWAYLPVSIDSAIHYGQQAVTVASGISNPTLEAQARNDYGTALLLKGNLDAAIVELSKGMTIRKSLKDSSGTASIQLKLGNCYYKAGKLDSAMLQFTSALAYFEKENKAFESAQIQGNIGALYFTMGNYAKAIDYQTKSAGLLESLNRSYELSNTLVNIGNTYLKTKDTSNGLIYYRKAQDIAEASKNIYAQSAALNNLSNISIGKKEFPEAIRLAKQSIELRKSIGLDGEQASARTTLAIAYNATGAYKPALDQLQQALPIAAAGGLSEQLISIYLQTAIAFGGLQRADSMQYYLVLHEAEKNRFTEKEMLKASAELETRYQSAQKDAALEKSKASLRFRNLALGGVSVLLLSGIIIALLYFKQQKLSARTREMARLNDQRMQISRELHDNIGSYLTFIKASVEQADEGSGTSVPLQDIRELTDETIAELRKTVWLMNNPEIQLAAFNSKLIDFYKKIASVKVLPLSGDTDMVLGNELATHLFRIIQEAVTNALKHAGASLVTVQLEAENGLLKASISDSGAGMDTSSESMGSGLRNLRERVKELEGKLEIRSEKGNGTRLSIELPLIRSIA
jgi:signal transduction histidine kinase